MSDSQLTTPLPNDPAARTPDGTLKDAGTGTIPTSPTSTTPTESQPDGTAKPATTPATGETPKPTGPDTYTFTPPEGQTYDKTLLDAATPIFKELGLSQAQADKLVEVQAKWARSQADLAIETVKAQREKWVAEVMRDPDLGPKLEAIKTDIGRAFAAINDPALEQSFKDAMNLTGAGDNPAFIKTFHKFAQKFIEGKPVSGTGASPNGQTPTGQVQRPSAAQAMYPNLARQ
jgi:hypothetical protein